MVDARRAAQLSELDALQQARARLFLLLDGLTDHCDTQTFCDVLADVATLHAQHSRLSAADRARWQQLADAAQLCLGSSPAACLV
jgi:hypothetical protein